MIARLRACGNAAWAAYWGLMACWSPPSSALSPLRAAGARLGAFWVAKFIGISGGLTLFFVAYFYVLQHPRVEPWTMAVTPLDRIIGFQPAALILYVSLWGYVALAPALLCTAVELRRIAAGAVGLAGTGLTIFWLWPTRVAADPIPEVGRGWAFEFLRSVDASGNACPSLHVAFAVFAAAWLARTLAELRFGRVVRGSNWVWCAAIAYSTIAVRQHVVWDVLAGAALGAVASCLNLRRHGPVRDLSR